jgi:hypothetical protein
MISLSFPYQIYLYRSKTDLVWLGFCVFVFLSGFLAMLFIRDGGTRGLEDPCGPLNDNLMSNTKFLQ